MGDDELTVGTSASSPESKPARGEDLTHLGTVDSDAIGSVRVGPGGEVSPERAWLSTVAIVLVAAFGAAILNEVIDSGILIVSEAPAAAISSPTIATTATLPAADPTSPPSGYPPASGSTAAPGASSGPGATDQPSGEPVNTAKPTTLATAGPSSIPKATPSPSPKPTTSPSPKPTPSLEPKPTPSPKATPSPDPGAALFVARVSKGASTISGLADDTEAAVKGKDFGAVASFAAQIGDRALADSAWLKANQPSACYKAAHQSATEAYGEIKLAADSIVAASKTADVPTIDAQLVMIRDEIAVLESAAAAAGNC